MSALPTPIAIEFARPPGRPYANLYRFGAGPGAPLVLYFGGAISRTEHEARRRTPPTPIAETFPASARVDLLVCPCPIDTGSDEEGWLTEHHDALIERLGMRPSALACVGYSAGAGYATWLGAVEGAAAIGCIGPAGVPRALGEVEGVLRERPTVLELGWFINDGDPIGGATDWMRRFAPVVAFHTHRSSGGHPFADYARNGSVTAAFSFVLARLDAVAR